MKITINVDCSPEEARTFLGLPDLSPVHAAYVERMQALVSDGVSKEDMEKMMRQWLPTMTEGFEQMQKAFWSAATGAGGGSKS